MTRALQDWWRREDGGLSAVAMMLFLCSLMIIGVSVDYAYAIKVRTQLRLAVDAAALAASYDIQDEETATAEGLAIAAAYLDGTDFEGAISAADFTYGRWDTAANTFVAGATPHDSVRVGSGRTGGRSNPIDTMFMRLVGTNTLEVSAVSVARAIGDQDCHNGGLFSNTNVNSGSNNAYLDGFCLYGNNGVQIGSDNSFEAGVEVMMTDPATFVAGSSNTGVAEALKQQHYTLDLPNAVGPLMTQMGGGDFSAMPPTVTSGPVYLSEIQPETALTAGTMYVVSGVVDLGGNRMVRDIAISSSTEIKLGSDSTLENTLLVTTGKISIDSFVDLGGADYCSTDYYSVYLFGGDNIEFGSNNTLRGVQMASKQMIQLGSNVSGMSSVHGEALGDIDYGSNEDYSGCNTDVPTPPPPSGEPSGNEIVAPKIDPPKAPKQSVVEEAGIAVTPHFEVSTFRDFVLAFIGFLATQ